MEGLDSFKMVRGDEDSRDYNSPMIELYCPNVSDQLIALQNLGLCNINVLNNDGSFNATAIEGVLDMDWTPPEPLLREDRSLPTFSSVLPGSLSQSPTTFGVIEQVARFSCFRGESFGDMLNSFSIPGSTTQHRGVFSGARLNSGTQGQENETNVIEGTETFTMSTEHGTCTGSPENEWKTESFIMSHNEANRGQGNESVEAKFGNRAEPYQYEGTDQGQGTLAKGHGSKKRKKIVPQDTELDQVKRAAAPFELTKRTTEIRKKGDKNPSSTANKPSGGHGKPRPQASDSPKQEYIHVRARRGQATSSHSLAERLRREKISERMKYLQDLVPGCSKVTGKAIMLDEIINYVESLQRQVEFLSMKIASVNPGLDFDIDGDNGKSIFQSEVGAPFVLGLYSDICMRNPQQHLSHPGTIQVSLLGTQTSSDALRRTISSQMTARCAGIEDSTSEVPYVRKDELCPLFRQV